MNDDDLWMVIATTNLPSQYSLSLWKVYKFHHSDIISTQERLGHNTTGLDGDDWTGLDRQGSNNQLKLGLPVCAVYLPTDQLKLLLL